MKKGNRAIAAPVAALILIGVLVGLGACQNGLTSDNEYLTLPPVLPYARIESTPGGGGKVNPRYVLEWRRVSGILYPDSSPHTYISQDAIDAAKQAAWTTWGDFEESIEPKPYIDGGGRTYSIFDESSRKIQNDNLGERTIVINRYWPAVNDDGALVSDVASWNDSKDTRILAYKKAVAEIKAMMAAIEKSPLYNAGESSDFLTMLHARMEECVKAPPGGIGQRSKFTFDSNMTAVKIDPGLSGDEWSTVLYEYYLGFVPDNSTKNYENDGPYAFPSP